MPDDLDNEVKVQPYYDGDLMRKFIAYMEMFAELSNDKTLTEQKHKICNQLFNHYRRMVINMAMKQFPEDFGTNDVLHIKEIISLLNQDPV